MPRYPLDAGVRIARLEARHVPALRGVVRGSRGQLQGAGLWSSELATPRGVEAWVRRLRAAEAEHRLFTRVIVCDGRLSGLVGLEEIDALSRSAGFWGFVHFPRRRHTARPQRRSIGVLATHLMVEYGFRELGLERIVARCAPENVLARRAVEGAGFRFEGTLRERDPDAGRFRDAVLYSILRGEWEATVARLARAPARRATGDDSARIEPLVSGAPLHGGVHAFVVERRGLLVCSTPSDGAADVVHLVIETPDRDRVEVGRSLFELADNVLQRRGCRLLRATLEPHPPRGRATLLRRCGFAQLTAQLFARPVAP